MFRTVITGTGSFIPSVIHPNKDFAEQVFYAESQLPLDIPPGVVVEKFKNITGIEERRYASDELTASDLGAAAAVATPLASSVKRYLATTKTLHSACAFTSIQRGEM